LPVDPHAEDGGAQVVAPHLLAGLRDDHLTPPVAARDAHVAGEIATVPESHDAVPGGASLQAAQASAASSAPT